MPGLLSVQYCCRTEGIALVRGAFPATKCLNVRMPAELLACCGALVCKACQIARKAASECAECLQVLHIHLQSVDCQ